MACGVTFEVVATSAIRAGYALGKIGPRTVFKGSFFGQKLKYNKE